MDIAHTQCAQFCQLGRAFAGLERQYAITTSRSTDMHPFNYDITVKNQKLELDLALRKLPPYEVAMQVNRSRNANPRRIDLLFGWLLSPAKTRREFAD